MSVAAFYAFMAERESVRIKKERGDPWPWTDDPILQEFKFTNVRRSDDKTTRKLVELFYDRHGQTSFQTEILVNCAVFRYFGTWEFAQAFGWQRDVQTFRHERLKQLARERLQKRLPVFTGAYIITNQGIRAPKYEVVSDIFIKGLVQHAQGIVDTATKTGSWRQTAHALQLVPGFGGSGFMAKEVLLDTMHCRFWQTPTGLPHDYWAWTPIGPGARRGLERVTGRELKEKELLPALLEIYEQQEQHWPVEHGSLAPTDVQFQLCEFDKFLRTKNGEGRPRSRYRPPTTLSSAPSSG